MKVERATAIALSLVSCSLVIMILVTLAQRQGTQHKPPQTRQASFETLQPKRIAILQSPNGKTVPPDLMALNTSFYMACRVRMKIYAQEPPGTAGDLRSCPVNIPRLRCV